jgi:hypothetical protein
MVAVLLVLIVPLPVIVVHVIAEVVMLGLPVRPLASAETPVQLPDDPVTVPFTLPVIVLDALIVVHVIAEVVMLGLPVRPLASAETPVQLPDDPVTVPTTLPVRSPKNLVAVTVARTLSAPDELKPISSVYASAVVLLPNDKPPPPSPYWLMKYDFPLPPSRFQVSQVPCTFVADDDATISALLALNVPDTLRSLLIAVDPP